MKVYLVVVLYDMRTHRRGGSVVDCSPPMREIGVRSPIGTYLRCYKTGSDSSTTKRSATGASAMVLGDDYCKRIING